MKKHSKREKAQKHTHYEIQNQKEGYNKQKTNKIKKCPKPSNSFESILNKRIFSMKK